MKRIATTIVLLAMLAMCGFARADEPRQLSKDDKAKLGALLNSLKVKGKATKSSKYTVAVPVGTAGVRATEVDATDRFAVLWPGESISPLTALAQNLMHESAHAADRAALVGQVLEFIKVFPEYGQDQGIQDIAAILQR